MTTLTDYLTKLRDPAAQLAREKFCGEMAHALDQSGRALWAFGWVAQEPQREALALVTQMAASLSQGAALLFSSENWYGGAGLVRQLVEVEYLMFLFATDLQKASLWRKSTHAERRKFFSPVEMRKQSKGLFLDSEYQAHCERGGHPTMLGQDFLPEHQPMLGTNLWLWIDLAQHLERLWVSFEKAVDNLGCSNVRVVSDARRMYPSIHQKWRTADECAGWIAIEQNSDAI